MIKWKYIHLTLLINSIMIYIFLNFYENYQNKKLESSVSQMKIENENLNDKFITSEKNIEKNEIELEKNEKLYKLVKQIENENFSLDEINLFVNSFETIVKDYKGMKKITYEIHEQDKKLSINIEFSESYENLRSFIYALEKEFYFLEINYLRVERDEQQVRGNINIQVYFRGENNK